MLFLLALKKIQLGKKKKKEKNNHPQQLDLTAPGKANWVAQLEEVYATVLLLARHLTVCICLQEKNKFYLENLESFSNHCQEVYFAALLF